MAEGSEIVLITGGCGFLGQHIVRELQERDTKVKEIRILDLKQYCNNLNHAQVKPVVSYIGDICDVESIRTAFVGVSCVFHCAALVSYDFPPNKDELIRVNVRGTRNVVDLCIENDVGRLVYTSTTEVTLVPYFRRGTFSILVNQTECKAHTPTSEDDFVIPGYPESKLRAEKLVLTANGAPLSNGDILKTVSLRPTLMYGEHDKQFITTCIKIAKWRNGEIPKIAGVGGKQQVTYAGNVAWAHIRAKDTLCSNPRSVGGLPVFITDDTPIDDLTSFCDRVTRHPDGSSSLKVCRWSIPATLSYLAAMLVEVTATLAHRALGCAPLPVSPCAVISYLSSMLLYSRLRAALHLEYTPVYSADEGIRRAAEYYVMIGDKSDLNTDPSAGYLKRE